MRPARQDVDYYVALCKRYGEKPEMDEYGANPYCPHAQKLMDRRMAEGPRKWLIVKKEDRDQ